MHNKPISAVFFALLLATLCSANSLLVTVSYDNDVTSIKHAEVIAADAPAYNGIGYYALAYKLENGLIQEETRFDFPLVSFTGEDVLIQESAEKTLVIPLEPGAKSLSVYDGEGKEVASLSLEKLAKPGDAIGMPPKDSLAARTGQMSVAGALANATGAGGSPEPKGSCCGPAFILLAALYLSFFFLNASSKPCA